MGGLDLDLGADLKAHRTPGGEHDGVPDESADRRARRGRGIRGRGSGRGVWEGAPGHHCQVCAQQVIDGVPQVGGTPIDAVQLLGDLRAPTPTCDSTPDLQKCMT